MEYFWVLTSQAYFGNKNRKKFNDPYSIFYAEQGKKFVARIFIATKNFYLVDKRSS